VAALEERATAAERSVETKAAFSSEGRLTIEEQRKLARKPELTTMLAEAEQLLAAQPPPPPAPAPAPVPEPPPAHKTAAAREPAAVLSKPEPSIAAVAPERAAAPTAGPVAGPHESWYAAALAWVQAQQQEAQSGGSHDPRGMLGRLGLAVPPPAGAPKLKKLLLRDKRFRIAPDGTIELA
jgi:hypothetical protein